MHVSAEKLTTGRMVPFGTNLINNFFSFFSSESVYLDHFHQYIPVCLVLAV